MQIIVTLHFGITFRFFYFIFYFHRSLLKPDSNHPAYILTATRMKTIEIDRFNFAIRRVQFNLFYDEN
jgi:hypothetical protein